MPISKAASLARRLQRNRAVYERRLLILKRLRKSFFASFLAQRVATLASNRHSGIYFSPELELILCEISCRIRFREISKLATKTEGTLHIMSQAYETGGHTRVVEKWIESSEPRVRHSLLLTRKGAIPKRLLDAVKSRGGDIYRFSGLPTNLEKAKWVRRVADSYSQVALHIHMDDVIPSIAFGDGTSSSKILLYNHADHRFWVGASIPAQVLELRKWGQSLSFHLRGITNSQIVGIPTDSTSVTTDAARLKARDALGLDPQSKLILTVGNSKKYIELGPTSLPVLVAELLRGHPNRVFIGVGPSKKDNQAWETLAAEFPEKVKLIPEVQPELLELYLDAADLGVDSFPLNGGNVAWEMLGRGVPYLTMLGVAGHTDEIAGSTFCFEDRESFIEKANQVLFESGDTFRNDAVSLHERIMKSNGPSAWGEKVLAIGSGTQFPAPAELPLADLRLLDLYLVAEAGWRENLLS